MTTEVVERVLEFCEKQLKAATRRPIIVGIQAPQGAGKTTLVRRVLAMMPERRLKGAGVSIDDFYLTRAEQLAVAAANPGNPYLEHRGYPGTHDITLGRRTLLALGSLASHAAGRVVDVPVYDKAAHGGRGDRKPESEWREVPGPLDVVFVEGWMLGFTPAASTGDDKFLVEPNRALKEYWRWYEVIDAWIVFRPTDPNVVLKWRVGAEEESRAQGRGGLDRAAIEDYVRRFLPAYAKYGGAPGGVPAEKQMEIWIDDDRRPVSRPPK